MKYIKSKPNYKLSTINLKWVDWFSRSAQHRALTQM